MKLYQDMHIACAQACKCVYALIYGLLTHLSSLTASMVVVVVLGWGSVEAHDIRDRLCSQFQDGGGIVGAGGWGVGGQEGQPGTFFRSLVEWRVAEVLTVQPPETWPST